MKVKAWQMAVIVVGLLIGVASLVWTFATTEAVAINHEAYGIDVETGQIYRINTERFPVVWPAYLPDKQRACLVRLHRDDEKNWFVNGRDRALLRQLGEGVKNTAVDETTGKLLVPAKEPVEYVRTWK